MDFLTTHWFPKDRRFASGPRVASIGYLRKSPSDWVRRAFSTLNFSMVLEGGGELLRGGRRVAVRAPALLAQLPDDFVEYGPTEAFGYWEELYVIYEASAQSHFERAGFLDGAAHWPMGDGRRARHWAEELRLLASRPYQDGDADRVDRICELMVLESRLGLEDAEGRQPERAVEALRSRMQAEPLRDWRFDEEAAKAGMALTTFRRHWLRRVGAPPQRFLNRLRLQEACRQLVETSLRVGEVARRTRFSDPLYFSRRFHQEMGVSATDYRRRHQSHLASAPGSAVHSV